MRIEFSYTLDDLREAHNGHAPKTPERRSSSGRMIGTALFAVTFVGTFALLGGLSPDAASPSSSHRPVLLDMTIPVIALAVFLTPWLAYRALKARGAKGMWSTRAIVGWVGWLLAAVMLVLLWRMLNPNPAEDSDAAVAADAAQSSWQRVSDFLLPHAGWLLFLAAFCIFIIRYIGGQLTMLWKGSPTLHRPYTMTVADDGITFAEPLARHELKWFAFDRLIETQNLFLLYITEHSFHMVPKRAFAHAGELDEFRATIDNRITRRPTAFPVLPVAG